MKEITLKIDDTVAALLAVLDDDGDAAQAIERLIDHAQQGVYRPMAWERDWLCQAFGDEWLDRLEPGDPYGRPEPGPSKFARPKQTSG